MYASNIKKGLETLAKNLLRNEKFCGMYFGFYDHDILMVLHHSRTFVLSCKQTLSSLGFVTEVYSDVKPAGNKVEIVGNQDCILLLDSEGSLYELQKKCTEIKNFTWVQFKRLNFTKVLAITAFKDGFVCLGREKCGKKLLKFFKKKTLPDFEDYTFIDLNTTGTNNYYLNSTQNSSGEEYLIISDKFSGRTYVSSKEKRWPLIHCSNVPLISVISFPLRDCLLLCFENGKLVVHFNFSSVSYNFFLNKKIKCIVKCICTETCFLWSDGVRLHHTGIDFDSKKMVHFKVETNIPGIISLASNKSTKTVVAVTVNNMYYVIDVSHPRKELFQSPSDILSEIYNESLRLNDFQKNLKAASDYLKLKEIIQKNDVKFELNRADNFLSIKNLSNVTFKKEFCKIELKTCSQGCERVRVVELEADLVEGMMLKIKSPFANTERVKVYLFGISEWDILYFCIGVIGETDVSEKDNLKKILDNIKIQKNAKILKK